MNHASGEGDGQSPHGNRGCPCPPGVDRPTTPRHPPLWPLGGFLHAAGQAWPAGQSRCSEKKGPPHDSPRLGPKEQRVLPATPGMQALAKAMLSCSQEGSTETLPGGLTPGMWEENSGRVPFAAGNLDTNLIGFLLLSQSVFYPHRFPTLARASSLLCKSHTETYMAALTLTDKSDYVLLSSEVRTNSSPAGFQSRSRPFT